jgi:hypothetical protein
MKGCRIRDRGDTRSSRVAGLVGETPGTSPRGRRPSLDLGSSSQLARLCRDNCELTVVGAGSRPPERAEGARECDVPGISLTPSSTIRHGSALPASNSLSPGARSPRLPGLDLPHSRAGRPRKADFVSAFRRTPLISSRPGRLVAATACPGRHETPGTHLGRAGPPRRTPNSDGRDGRTASKHAASRPAATDHAPAPPPTPPAVAPWWLYARLKRHAPPPHIEALGG